MPTYAPAPKPEPTYAPAPKPEEPKPMPTYAPAPKPEPTYAPAPAPKPEPTYAPAPKPEPTYAPKGTGSYTASSPKFTGAANANAGMSIAGLAGVAALAFAL